MSSPMPEEQQQGEENGERATERKRTSSDFQSDEPGCGGPDDISPEANAKKLKTAEDGSPTKEAPKVSGFGECKLAPGKRFFVEIDCGEQLVSAYKTVPSAHFDKITKLWTFHLTDQAALCAAVEKSFPLVSVQPIPEEVLNMLWNNSVSWDEEVDLSRIDSVCREALLPFQVDGVKFCISKGGRAMIADEMGLGKTIQALAVAHYYKRDWPLLIVCPSSVRFAWKEAFRMWFPSIPLQDVVVMTSGEESITDAEILIISYDLMTRQKDVLEKMMFGVLILDESHSLKNYKTKRTKAVQPLVRTAKRVLLLSGTPAPSRPVELYSQLCLIRPYTMMNFCDFGIRYCDGHEDEFGYWKCKGASNLDELQVVLRECFMISRLKKDYIAQLPGKFRHTIVLPASSININKEELQRAKENLDKLVERGATNVHSAVLEYYHETGEVKANAVSDYISELLVAGEKLICFAHHIVVLDAICEKVKKSKIKYIRIDGSTKAKKRQELCHTFQTNPKCKLAVLSITAANTGITLTAAHKVVFAELYWNPGTMLQAEDRVHRIGQEKTVVIQYLLAKNTCDGYMWLLMKNKLEVLNKAGMKLDNFTSSVNILEDVNGDRINEFLINFQPETGTVPEEDSNCAQAGPSTE